MCVGRNEVGIEAVEALRPSLDGPFTVDDAPPSGVSAPLIDGPVGVKGTLGYCSDVEVLGTVGQVAVGVSTLARQPV